MINSISRWTPTTLARDPFFRVFDSMLNNQDLLPSEEVSNRTWMPPVDIQETADSYRLTAELPGLTRDDINITLENNVLRLTGERKFEKDAKKDGYHRIERTYGAFSRAFTLPSQVNHEKVEAAFENGLLTISVPKAEQAKPRKITIG